ncbi:MAG: hypothetical protein IKN33_07450, partial [Selenomonadaceae bacterium]|nr:hypothetical protein [Selenomonadaceae bacterium]
MDASDNHSGKGEKFLKGTFILTIAGFVVKVIGSLNWIFVSRILVRSDSVSSEAVASSRIRIGGFLRIARAIE